MKKYQKNHKFLKTLKSLPRCENDFCIFHSISAFIFINDAKTILFYFRSIEKELREKLRRNKKSRKWEEKRRIRKWKLMKNVPKKIGEMFLKTLKNCEKIFLQTKTKTPPRIYLTIRIHARSESDFYIFALSPFSFFHK
jgi:hypothetical protein